MITIHHILTTKSHSQRQKRGAFEFRYISTTRRPNFIHGRYPRSFLGPIRPRTWLTVFCHFIKSNSTSLYYPSFQSPFTTRFIYDYHAAGNTQKFGYVFSNYILCLSPIIGLPMFRPQWRYEIIINMVSKLFGCKINVINEYVQVIITACSKTYQKELQIAVVACIGSEAKHYN
jgi:hypothetical protein